MRISTAILALLPSLGVVSGYANPGACSGTCTNTHDPSIIRRSDGTYFRFSTGGKIAVHTAPDITGPWTYQGAALPSGSKINLAGNQDLWAPDVSLVGSTYYLYYSVSTFGVQDSAIGVATSSSLDVGTWTDLGSTGIQSASGKPYNAIDPNLINASGTYLITFGSFWQDIYQVAMASTPSTLASGASTYQVAYDPIKTDEEGSFVFKNGNYYYLFFSKGQCCGYDTSKPAAGGEYKIMVCRSTSATGGYVDSTGTACTNSGGTVVLESHGTVYGPGGQGVYNDPTHGPILYYHYVDTTIGYADAQKQFGWNTIDFSSGWPVV
ncbi:glycoside hydrolase family 43 protein [Annulohypoxylon truncatum]|uniref:glycoside hydrolase family 43 protein n=1 Tax=Annulohypoxylon truncatum TaxID=327061 RepID=UPI00200883C4|nr:glycoside hydrolase family 43 protein [Annulohypoxylon truncatum]KAI1206350.1 glycoside hydrolase family 43 protein [Annulohypoxylon truncatum]